MNRYDRQLQMEEWDIESQAKLTAAHVTVVGAGGLGSPVLYYLAAAGVGHIHLIDNDKVHITNLNRQILYTEQDIGRMKAAAAAERLFGFNSTIDVSYSPLELNAENVTALVPASDAIVDCLDNFKTRFVLNGHAVAQGIPLIHAGIHGFNGQLTTVIPHATPCLECLFSGIQDPADDTGQKMRRPVLGAVVGLVGSMQALEAVKLITGRGKLYTGKLVIYDGMQGTLQEMQVERDKNCPVCATGRQ